MCKPSAESNLFELCRGAAKLHEGIARIIGESTNRLMLRLSECRSNAVTEPVEVPSIDYAEREQLHEGVARIISDELMNESE